jgi:hypothetical protein
VRVLRSRVRGAVAELRALAAAAFALAVVVGSASIARAADPAPAPTKTPPGTVTLRTAKQPEKLVPLTKLHADYTVEVNHLGQVVKVKSGHDTKDLQFNALTYGNVLQMAIRTPDGMHAVVGTYRVNYDFNPTNKKVSRTIDLLSEGGVDPNAEGAVNSLLDMQRRSAEHAAAAKAAAAKAAAAKHRTLASPAASPKP